ncbi:hypothetical protein NDU88_001567 [Pleurodeles waltl]|uniref:Uncharacterized protein n=1 Tax=Pleurodeles waltl TaxID=8319 RepID=A0AAV7T0J2_PLEWA|nr:hypothetical protein NDU88_001567 [Pleurodeles waltl]
MPPGAHHLGGALACRSSSAMRPAPPADHHVSTASIGGSQAPDRRHTTPALRRQPAPARVQRALPVAGISTQRPDPRTHTLGRWRVV